MPSFTSKNQRCWDKWWAVSKCSPMHVLSQSEMLIMLSGQRAKGITLSKQLWPQPVNILSFILHHQSLTTASAKTQHLSWVLPLQMQEGGTGTTQDNGERIKDAVQPLWKGTAKPNGIEHYCCSKQRLPAPSFPPILCIKSILYWLYTSCQKRVSNAGLNNVFTDTIPRIQQNSWSRCFLPCILSGKKFQRCKFAVNTHRTYRTSYYSSGEHSGTKKHTVRTGGATCKHFGMEIFSSLQSKHTVDPPY